MGVGKSRYLRTLGGLELWIGDDRMDGNLPAKAGALLVLLAERNDKIARSEAAGLLWSDHSESRARGNLRVTLKRLRATAPGVVDGDRTWLWLDGDLGYDCARLAESSPDEIAELYRGDFLDGLNLRGAELFDEWADQRRAELRMTAAAGLNTAADDARTKGEWQRCLRFSRTLVGIAPWREDGLRLLLESTAATEGRSAAIALFEQLADRLEADLGVDPEQATLDLVAEFRAGSEPNPQVISSRSVPSPPPTYRSTFVGRQTELALIERISRPGQPVSIVAPGGTGKSRLLAQLAHRRLAVGQRVLWVSFESRAASSGELTTRAVVEETLTALNVPVDTQAVPMESLVATLGSTPQTVCFDNVEHLADIEGPISMLAQSCPELEIVLTTRRRMMLASGEVVELGGLDLDESGEDERSAAVQLFIDRAQHRNLDGGELGRIAELCRLVDGHPLAIELGAQWTSTSSTSELIERLSTAAGLGTKAVDVPQRHRSLDVVVSSSTRQLSHRARQLLRTAAVFSAGSTKQDLEAVTDVADGDLAELVEHSMMTIEGKLYRLHPIIRAYVLRAVEPEIDPKILIERHASRMVELLAVRTPGSTMSFRSRAEDLRRAIRWRIAHAGPDALIVDLRRYLELLRAWGWYRNTHVVVTEALRRDDLAPAERAELHRNAAEASFHTHDLDDVAMHLERGLTDLGQRAISRRSLARNLWNLRAAVTVLTGWLVRPSPEGRRRAAEQARLMSLFGELCYVTDRRPEMASYALGSVAAGRLSGERSLRAAGDAALAIGAQLAGYDRTAERYRRRARRHGFSSANDPFTVSETAGVAALVAAGSGQWDDALRDADAALAAAEDAGRIRSSIQLSILKAIIESQRGRPAEALALLSEVERDVVTYGLQRSLPWVHATRAEALLRSENADPEPAASEAMASALAEGSPADHARASVIHARLAYRRNDAADAIRHLERAVPVLGRDAAIAIHYAEAHLGAAQVAAWIECMNGDVTTLTDSAFTAAETLSQSIPIVRPKLRLLHAQRVASPGRAASGD